jgi:hypothetical protein
MRALILDYPIIAILNRTVAFDGDDGMRRHPSFLLPTSRTL